MKAEEVYELAPDVIDDDMIKKAQALLSPAMGEVPFEDALPFAEAFLEVAKEYYRRGAFDMEHREGAKCQAEDQGGWPCCSRPAEFFVRLEFMKNNERRPVYCSDHRAFNRFYRDDQMSPIFSKPDKKEA